MSIAPIITFKAGVCTVTPSQPPRVKPDPRPGYVYLFPEEDLIHFCWRPRDSPADEPELDLILPPADAHFDRYLYSPDPPDSEWRAPTNGRIAVLKFSSSSDRHFFWLQAKAQGSEEDPSWWSRRDKELILIVDQLLSGEEVNVEESLANIPEDDDDGADGDADMPDADGTDRPRRRSSAGGAGPDATGGDVRTEGEESREGGADGARAAAGSSTIPADASAIVQNFLNSIGSSQQQRRPKVFTTLNELLSPGAVLPTLQNASSKQLDSLLSFLPAEIPVLFQQESDTSSSHVSSQLQGLSVEQKRALLIKVVQSPQFQQSLASLTVALRDGGLPSVSEALGVRIPGGGFSLAGGEAVQAFVEGVKEKVKSKLGNEESTMNVD